MVRLSDRSDGFTLVELLVAITIALIVMSAIFSTYRSQQKSNLLQEQVASMQQNLRAALYYMAREIRMAGCDPTGTSLAGITAATPTTFGFTRDIRGNDPASNTADGDTNDNDESITYSLYDAYGDGDNDIGRNSTGTIQPLAENIDALDFIYLDQSGTPLSPIVIGNIVSMQITIVARTGRGDQGYVNNDVFFNQQGTQILGAQNDNFHRKRLTTHIRCRNF